ncbi:MAG: flavodoxin, short chain [Herbinix sp.]|jgi:flavodoxin short chain|nr:flavodoxin, short chain [Herbinix sp.]
MDKIIVAYWSQTGNTQEMAEAIGKGIEEAGKQAEVLEISKVTLEDLKEASVFALGCPAMGGEVLEEDEMEPFVNKVEKFVAGKQIGLFGSYDWGDGQWMRDWEERMIDAGAVIVGGEGIIANNTPDNTAVEACIEMGKALASV